MSHFTGRQAGGYENIDQSVPSNDPHGDKGPLTPLI